MIKMDFKGITWVGNVYQKFEAMCLEVEEVMYEDTVKYVENQVQTVGATMKKFYSEVMKDVLSPSSIDPVKVAAADLSLNPYGDFGIHKKPKLSTKKDVASHKCGSEDLKVIAGPNKNCSTKVLVELNREAGSIGKSRGVIKRIPQRENNLPSEVSRSFTLSQDLNRVSTCCKMDNNYDVATDRSDTEMCTNKRSDSSHQEDFHNVASAIVSSAHLILPSESVANKERQLKDITSPDPPDVSSAEINGACGNDGVDSMMKSYISCDPGNSESVCEGSSPTGDPSLSFIKCNNDIAEPRAEAVQEFDKSNCVVVGREDLSVAAPKEDKSRSYKKKIRKAFSSKMSARKQEYKQLAVQYGCLAAGPNQEVADSSMPELLNVEKSPPCRISESEWELL